MPYELRQIRAQCLLDRQPVRLEKPILITDMYPHQKKVPDQIGGSEFFPLGIEALEDEMRIVMLVAGNADQRKTINDRQMDGFELIGCQSLQSRQEELIALVQTIFRNLVFPDNGAKRGSIILRRKNLQPFVVFLVCVC